MVRFSKAHGAKNDFLLTWSADVPPCDPSALARAICDRHTGVGADGWIVVDPAATGADASIRLFNADGGEVELSGNGTRCVAALLVVSGKAEGERVRIATAAGLKELRVVERSGNTFLFEMNMGRPKSEPQHLQRPLALRAGEREVTVLDVGNPQCAVLVDEFPADWETVGAEIESHPVFPRRTNVSFVRPVDEHTIEARFYERGVGVTMSSGTGSTGAAAAAILRKVARSPVRVLTPAGPLDLRWEDDMYLVGPAELVARGEFFFEEMF